MANKDIVNGFRKTTGGPLEATWGPHLTMAAACEAIPSVLDGEGLNVRSGKTVAVGTLINYVEYTWQGGFEDVNLLPKVKPSTAPTKFTGFELDGFYNLTGDLIYNVNFSSTFREIEAGFIEYYLNSPGGTFNLLSFFRANGTYISGVPHVSPSGVKTGEVAIPADAVKVGISTLKTSVPQSYAIYKADLASSVALINKKITSKADSGYTAGETPKTLKEVDYMSNRVAVKKTDFPVNGFYQANGEYNSAATWGSVTIDVNEGDTVSYYLSSTGSGSGAKLVTFLDSASAAISSVNAVGAVGYKSGSATAPEGTVKATLSTLRAGTDAYYETTSQVSDLIQEINTELSRKQDKSGSLVLTVKKTGVPSSTHFNTLKAAVAAWVPGAVIQIFDGIYTENSIDLPDGIYIKGIGTVEIRGYLPVIASTIDVDAKSTIDWKNSGTLENLIITCQNMRYPVHSDFGSPNAIQIVRNCRIIHLGNYEIYKYRLDNAIASPNAASDVWRAMSSWGCGTQAGSRIYLYDCYIESQFRAFSTHNNANYNLTGGASYIECTNCDIVSFGIDRDNTAAAFAPAAFIQNLGSLTDDTVVFNNCRINGHLVLQSSSQDWREFTQKIKGGGNTSHLMQVRNAAGSAKGMSDQTTLKYAYIVKVKSNTSNEITVSGNLLSAIFGQYDKLVGSAGLNSYIKARINANTAYANVNAYSGEKTITFTSGSETKTLTLSATYTSHTQLIADMNAQFGAGSFVAELYWQGLDWYPMFTHEVNAYKNNGASAILRGRAVKKSGYNGVAPMTSADPANLFFGIAVQDIPVGKTGDVKFKGYMLKIWVDGLDASTLVNGDKIKVNSDGSFSRSADGTGVIVSECVANQNISINI